MITAAKLRARTAKDLAAMAKKKKVPGWHAMRKEQLIRALMKHAKAQAEKKTAKANGNVNGKLNGKATRRVDKPSAAKKPLSPHAKRQLTRIKKKLSQSKNLAFQSLGEDNGLTEDRLVVMVRDPYWLHAYWEMTRASIERAEAALGQYWHGSQPILRVNEVVRNGTTSTVKKIVRDIPIHGGVNNWYIDVQDPPKSYQIEIGYLASAERFYTIAKSNVVTTPRANSGDQFDTNWSEVAKDFERVYAMSGGYLEQQGNGQLKQVFEEQLRRPMGDPMSTKFGVGAGAKQEDMDFRVETELIVHGETHPNAHVTFRGEPIHLREDGTFAVRFSLPDRRHVLPVVASSPDGVEQRTIVLAIDRNTKVMEPVIREPGQ